MRCVFDSLVRPYVREELQRYPDQPGLRNMLVSKVDEISEVFSFIPALPPQEYIEELGSDVYRHSLEWYYRNDSEYPGTSDQAPRFISEWLLENDRRLALFQTDHFRFQEDSGLTRMAETESVLVVDDVPRDKRKWGWEGWIHIRQPQVCSADVELAIARGTCPFPPVIGLLTELPKNYERFAKFQRIRLDDCVELVSRAEYLLVQAFDVEVMLICRLSQAASGPGTGGDGD